MHSKVTIDRAQTREKLRQVTGILPYARCREGRLLRLCREAGIVPVELGEAARW